MAGSENELTPSSEEVDAHVSKLEDRLRNYLAQEEADLGSIRVMGDISFALWSGIPAHDIVADLGGIEEVEKLAGPKLSAELKKEIQEEG